MIVSKDDLECIVQNAIDKLLEQRENKPEVFLTAEETAKRLKVNKDILSSTKSAAKFATNYLTLKEYKREN